MCGTGGHLPQYCIVTKQLQARLIGALLLLTLAAIFFPVIFTADGLAPVEPEAAVRIDLGARIEPVSPPIDTKDKTKWQFWQRAEQQRRQLDASTQVQDFLIPEDAMSAGVPGGGTKANAQVNLDGVTFDESGVPVSWAVQAGSFANKANAEALKETLDNHPYLKEEGHGSALARLRNEDRQTIYRVAIGPFLDRRTAEKVQAVLIRDQLVPDATIRHFSMAQH